MPKKTWADWEDFAPVARQVVIDFIAAHPKHRPPKMRELTTPAQRWFYATCRKHGGLRATLKRLGFSLPRREDKPTRRSDWTRFSMDARPIIGEYLTKNHRLPTQKELRLGGHAWIDRAIEIHHGGYEAVYRRLGFAVSNEKPLSHWPTFVSKFQPAIDVLVQQLKRTPSYPEMVEAGHKLIVDAAYRSHGGYRSVLKKLGYARPCRDKRRGTGLANWQTFATAFRPMLEQFVKAHGRPPSKSELEKHGQQKYYFAARNHHGGYIQALQRLGYTPTPQQSIKPRQGWQNQTRQRATLRQHFPKLIELGIMPSSTMVKRHIPGLSAYWTWRRCRWADTAKKLGLVPYAIGRRQLCRYEAMTEALDFFQQHHRWPLPAEMSVNLRGLWTRETSWDTFFTPQGLLPTIQHCLQEALKNHWRWSERFHPSSASWSLDLYNQVVLARNHVAPPS